MPKIAYPQVIEEDRQELEKLEKRHRYTHLVHRVKMLRLLKSGECANLGQAAQALGYSWRQCQRWFAAYRRGGAWASLWSVGYMSVVLKSWSLRRPLGSWKRP